MKSLSVAIAGLAALALAAPVPAQQQKVEGKRAHTPRLGKSAAQSTGTTPKQINKASGGGVPHGPRTGSGKVVKSKVTAPR